MQEIAGSPAIDTAAATNAPAVDFDGLPRPVGTGFDMGAFEFRPPAPSGQCTTTLTGRQRQVLVTHGTTCLVGAAVSGNVVVTAGGSVAIVDTTVLVARRLRTPELDGEPRSGAPAPGSDAVQFAPPGT